MSGNLRGQLAVVVTHKELNMKLKTIAALAVAGIVSLGAVSTIYADDIKSRDAREQLMKGMGGALGGLMKGAATDKVAAVQVLVDGFQNPRPVPEGSGEGTDALPQYLDRQCRVPGTGRQGQCRCR